MYHSAPLIDWEAVYWEQLPRIYNFLRYRLCDDQLAEDLTATTFERAWGRRAQYCFAKGSVATWLFAIARNVAIDHLRKACPEVSLDAATTIAQDVPVDELVQRRSDLARWRSCGAVERTRARADQPEVWARPDQPRDCPTHLPDRVQRRRHSAPGNPADACHVGDSDMNHDEFMKQFRKEPRPEFADALYERLSQQADADLPPSTLSPDGQEDTDTEEDNDMNARLHFAVLPGRQTYRREGQLVALVAALMTVLFGALLVFNALYNANPPFAVVQQAAETPTTLFERYINEAWNAGDLDVLDELLAPEFTHYDAALAEPITDIEALKAYVEQFRSNLPGVMFTIDQSVEFEDMVYARLTATGDEFTVPMTASARFADLKLTEVWLDANALLETRMALVEQQNAEVARKAYNFADPNKVVGETAKENAIWCRAGDPEYCGPFTISFRKSWVESLVRAFPDLELTFQQVVASGDTVFVELTGSGTFSKALTEPMTGETVYATNKKESWSLLVVATLEDGKITEEHWHWLYNQPVAE
jgi:predicted ester cyclase